MSNLLHTAANTEDGFNSLSTYERFLAYINKPVMITIDVIKQHLESKCGCDGRHTLVMTHTFKNKAESIMCERMLNAKILLDLEIANVIESKTLKNGKTKITIYLYTKMNNFETFLETKAYKEWNFKE